MGQQTGRNWDEHGELRVGPVRLQVDALAEAARDARVAGDQGDFSVCTDPLSGVSIPMRAGSLMNRDQFSQAVDAIYKYFDTVGSDERVESANADLKAAEILGGGLFSDLAIEPRRPGWVYVIVGDHGIHKIGRTENLDGRLRQLSTSSPYDLRILFEFYVSDCAWLESTLHDRYAKHRVRNEWFRLPDEVHAELAEIYKRLIPANA